MQTDPSSTRPKYEVALSFAGEDRDYVEQVARELRGRGISVFYDGYEETTLWGKNLYDHLRYIYSEAANFTVMFISEFYGKKLWTNHERESAQSRAFGERREYILPARFDDTVIPGLLKTVGYVDLREKTPKESTELVAAKLGQFEGIVGGELLQTSHGDAAASSDPQGGSRGEAASSSSAVTASDQHEFDLAKFNKLVTFASSYNGLQLSYVEARNWAEANLAISGQDLSWLVELVKYASSYSGLHMSKAEAKEWAEVHFDFFRSHDFGRFKELVKYASSYNGLQMNKAEAKEWAIKKLEH